MILLIFSDRLNLSFGPKPNSYPSHQFHWRHRELLCPYPTIQRIPADIDDLCNFNGGVSRHLYNRIGLYGMSSKKRTRTGAHQCADPGQRKHIAECTERTAFCLIFLLHCIVCGAVRNCGHFSRNCIVARNAWHIRGRRAVYHSEQVARSGDSEQAPACLGHDSQPLTVDGVSYSV